MTRRGVIVAALLLLGLAGCSSTKSKVPMVTFEAAGFLKVYLAERDEVIRQTAFAVIRCRRIMPDSPVDARNKCTALALVKEEWDRRDTIVYTAVLTGQPVSSVDWEKVAEIGGKFVGAAAGLAL